MARAPLDKPARFVWPPGLPADAPPPEPRTLVPAERSWWRTFEEDFLGRTAGPFTQRAEDAGWLPDTRADYCPRCGSSARDHEPQFSTRGVLRAGDEACCSWCAEQRLPWSNFVRLGSYDGVLRDAILDLKFTAWRSVGLELGRLLAIQLASELVRAKVPPERVLLVPVPTTWRRRLARGIDHTLVLARGMARHMPLQIGRPIARRHAPSQASMAASVREQNVAGVFHDKYYRNTNVRLIVVMDDVRTTGATLRAACRASRRWLRKASWAASGGPIPVWACAVGVTPTPRGEPAG